MLNIANGHETNDPQWERIKYGKIEWQAQQTREKDLWPESRERESDEKKKQKKNHAQRTNSLFTSFMCVMLFNFEMEFSTKNVYPKHNNNGKIHNSA